MSEYLDKVKTSTINMLLDVGADDSITETIKELAKGYCELYIGKKTPDQIRNELADFYVEDNGEGNTDEEYDYDYVEEDDEEEDFDVVHSDTSYETLCDRAINLLYTTSSYEEFCSLLTDEYEEPFSLFVLAWINILAVMDYLEAGMIHFEKKGSLGFDGCIELLKIACMESESAELVSYGELSVDALKAKISDRLSLTISNGTVEDYLKNRVYVEDINTVENNVSDEPTTDEDNLIKDILQYNNTLINIACKKIMQTYRDLFTSCYQVIKPYGVLCQGSFYSIKNGQVEVERSAEAKGIYRELMKRLDFEEVDSRSFDMNKIVEQFSNNPKRILYFPKQMLDFTFGTVPNDSGSYLLAKGITSWGSYEKQYAEPAVVKLLRATVINFHKANGFFKEDLYDDIAVRDKLKIFLDYVVKCFTACILVINWDKLYDNAKDMNSSFEVIGIKIRVTDSEHRVSLNNDIMQKIVNEQFMGRLGDTDALLEPAAKVGSSPEYTVVDLQHKFKPSVVNGKPLFAYVAMRALKQQGIDLDYKNLVLGKLDDESVLLIGKEVRFNNKLCHWIIAGSRSGKGVWTLLLTSAAIKSGKPVFYIDNKPDMASMFRSLSNGRMFCVNADYDASFDTVFNSCSPESFHWDKHLPDYLRREYGSDYSSYTSLFYLRAVMFVTSLIYVRGNVRTQEELYNKLGGEQGIVVVIDEVKGADTNISTLLGKTGKVGGTFYANSTLSKARDNKKKEAEGKPVSKGVSITEVGAWNTDLMRSLNETMLEIASIWKHKGLKGGKTEGDVSDVFLISQNIHEVDPTKLEYRPTNENETNGTCGDPFYNYLFSLGGDGFFGYNIDHTEYMCSGTEDAAKGRKAPSRLNGTARNFCFINNLELQEWNTIINTKEDSSATLSDNAVYFKPFLILNDAGEDSPYVAKDFKKAMTDSGLDFEVMKNMHRRPDGVLEPAIGFIPYIQEMAGGVDVKGVLSKSYDIANTLVKAFAPNYDGDCIDFIYDLRPEYMFTCKTMLAAYARNTHIRSCKIFDEFFGNGASSDSSKIENAEADDSVDFNNTEAYDRVTSNKQAGTSTASSEASNKNNEVTSSSDSPIPKTTTETKPYGSTTKSKASNWFSNRFTSNRGNKPTRQSDEYADAKASLDRLREKMKQAVDIVLQHPKYSHFSREFVEGLVDNLIMNIAKERGIPYERK